MRRLYETVIEGHFRENRQMLFLMGPRQVGKTTLGRSFGGKESEFFYFSWDNLDDRRLILRGPEHAAARMQIDRVRDVPPVAMFDELHKYSGWKTFLKGMFDSYPELMRILVTGSARLDVYKVGGDSLMGRYFAYRMHPLSMAELADHQPPKETIRQKPPSIDKRAFDRLVRFGGFPEPYLRNDRRFFNRWRRLRTQQLLKEDLRDLSRIQEVGRVEVLADLLRRRVGQLVSYTSLARNINVSVDTAKRWVEMLSTVYFCFPVRPWFKNVSRALRKEPKYFLWDWSLVDEPGARAENLVASALLKATQYWTDCGVGDFSLHFIRDKQKREVDFVVTRDQSPWFLVEVKASGAAGLSSHLFHFQEQTGAPHAFQVAFDLPAVRRDCFEFSRPVIVPAQTFLSQLV